MPTDKLNLTNFGVRGVVTLWRIDEKTGLKLPICTQPNQIQVSWGHIAAKQLGYRRQADRDDYYISAMYIEYENQVAPEDPVIVSSFERLIGREYYAELEASSDRGYLRVPMRLEPTLSVAVGSEGEIVLTDDELGNQLTFFAQSAGSAESFGAQFSHALNSKIYAASLIAMPKADDRARDIIFARTNFSTENQVAKEASSQIGITWDISFE